MQTLTYPSIEDAKEHWFEYFPSGSLLGDFETAALIEKRAAIDRSRETRVIVFNNCGKTRGILPILREIRGDETFWTPYFTAIFTASPLTIDPECWPHLFKTLPRPFRLEESSWQTFETAKKFIPQYVDAKPSNVIDLFKDGAFESYFKSLDKKTRATLRNCQNRNSDLRIERGMPNGSDFAKISKAYYDYCSQVYTADMLLQLDIFPLVFKKAQELGRLEAIGLYLDDRLVALNCGVLNEAKDCFCDYVCYRHAEDEDLNRRSLGIFAILESIRHIKATHPSCRWYDLASDFQYKKKFLNCFKCHAVFALECG